MMKVEICYWHVCNGYEFHLKLIGQVLVIDLDGGSLLRCYGDEEHIIPKKLQKALSMALKDDCGKFYENMLDNY